MCVNFQLSSTNSFGDIIRVPNLHYGALPPARPVAEKLSYGKQYLALSKYVQNFKFLALIIFEI